MRWIRKFPRAGFGTLTLTIIHDGLVPNSVSSIDPIEQDGARPGCGNACAYPEILR